MAKKYTSRELMEMAYEESLKSIGEHDDKPDPLVGAIITNQAGEVLATAHRGELRIGEHCEFTLIERKLKDKNLRDCVLYVTLEPCIDSVRTSPKRGCATHIQKARIGKVYIGMRDPDIDIENKGANELIKAGIEVEDFPADLNQKIRLSLKNFIAFKEREKLIKKKERQVKKIPYLLQSTNNVKIEKFSSDAVRKFISHSNAELNYPSKEFNDWAIGFDLAVQKGHDVIATKMGLLLFGEKVDELYPHSIFKVEIDYGDGKPAIHNITGPVSLQLPKVFELVKQKALKFTIGRSNAVRTEIESFPTAILREVLANAIIHRDYSIDAANNYIYISKDKIIVKSPGLPVPPFTIEDIRSMDMPSVSRNPKIMYVYNRMGMAEARGFGLRSLKDLPEKGYPLPLFELRGNVLEISLIRNKSALAEAKGFGHLNLSEEDEQGLVFIQKNENITVSQYAKELNITNKTAQRRLAHLVDVGIILKEGDKRWAKYLIKK